MLVLLGCNMIFVYLCIQKPRYSIKVIKGKDLIMITKIKFYKPKNRFTLVDEHRHYQARKTREKEVISMDKWLMGTDNELMITFADANGILHKNVSVDTSKMLTYFDGDDDFGDWQTFVWDFPTRFGHIFVHALDNKCYLNRKPIPSSSVVISIK